MAYYTGTVTSMTEALTALTNALVAEGWALNSGIYSKNGIFVRFAEGALSTGDPYIGAYVGDGQTGASLENESPSHPKMGTPSSLTPVTYPAEYHIHINEGIDEVYFFLNYDIERYLWLAFGKSSISLPGSGNWVAAIRPPVNNVTTHSSGLGIMISQRNCGDSMYLNTLRAVSAGLFFNVSERLNGSAIGNSIYHPHLIDTGLNGTRWNIPTGGGSYSLTDNIDANLQLYPLLGRALSWNEEVTLLPIQPHLNMGSSKVAMVADLNHARYVRLDNIEPKAVIDIGGERWKVYPFHKKVVAAIPTQVSSGSSSLTDHTYTLGVALRYDGP